MRVWAFPSFYPYDYPGEQSHGIFAHRQYKGMADSGADIKVIQPVMWHPGALFSGLHKDWKRLQQYNYPKQREFEGLTVYHPRIANMKPSRLFNKAHPERYVDAIVGFFRKNNIHLDPAKDIFFSQWIPDAVMVQRAAHKLGLKSAVLVIGDDVMTWPHKNQHHLDVFKETLLNADIRFSVAGYLAAEVNKLVGKDLPFNVIRRGVNYDLFKPASKEQISDYKKEFGIPGDKTVILTIGTSIVRKGWLDLFDALAEMKKVNDSFVLVGAHSGDANIDLNKEAHTRGLDKSFINLGEVEPQRINKLYNTADVFCLPSHSEGIANCVAEAMSTGLAVITTNVGGHPELVKSGETGILIPPMQPGILLEKLSSLIKNKAEREELGNNARNFIVNEWGSFADNSALIYKKLSDV